MKKFNLVVFCSAFICVFASSSKAGPYHIDICLVDLASIMTNVLPTLKQAVQQFNLKHVYVRGGHGNDTTDLHFEPIKPEDVIGGKARIGKQKYREAQCEEAAAFDTEEAFNKKWQLVVDGFEYAEKNYQYNILGVNCQTVSEESLAKAGLEMPQAISLQLELQNQLREKSKALIESVSLLVRFIAKKFDR